MAWFRTVVLLCCCLVLLPQKSTATTFAPTTLVKNVGLYSMYLVTSSEALVGLSKLVEKQELPFLQEEESIKNFIKKKPVTTAIILVNVVVYLLWQNMPEDFMLRHFTIQGNRAMRQRFPHSLLTHGFSHQKLGHIFNNMMGLRAFGQFLESELVLGRRLFVYFYIMAIYASSFFNNILLLTFSIQKPYSDLMNRQRYGLGASGATSAIQAYFCLLFPHAKVDVFGIGGVPTLLAIVLWFLVDASQVRRQQDTGVGHGVHIGGYLFGVLFYVFNDVIGPKFFFKGIHQRRMQHKLKHAFPLGYVRLGKTVDNILKEFRYSYKKGHKLVRRMRRKWTVYYDPDTENFVGIGDIVCCGPFFIGTGKSDESRLQLGITVDNWKQFQYSYKKGRKLVRSMGKKLIVHYDPDAENLAGIGDIKCCKPFYFGT